MKPNKMISSHKFIEYAFASPQRRTAIIENALQPPTYIMDTMYPDIERGASHFLVSKCSDASRLDKLDDTYLNREATSDHHEQRLLNAMDAIAHIKKMTWKLESDWTVDFAGDIPTNMELSGICIRVKAPVLIKRRQPGYRDPFIGVVKPYFGKIWPLRSTDGPERGILFATLLHWFTESNLNHLGNPDGRMCMVADVFSEEVHFAAKRHIQRRKQLVALAEEIADRWDPIAERLRAKAGPRAGLRRE